MKRATLSIVAGAGLVVAMLAGAWWALVQPYRQLDRPAETIAADWDALAARPPARRDLADPTPFDLEEDPAHVEPERLDRLVRALDDGARAPVGCTVLRDVEDDPLVPGPMNVFHAGRALLAHERPELAAALVRDLYQGDFLSLAVGAGLAEEVRRAGHPAPAPALTEVRAALVREAACGDALFELLLSGALTQDQAPPVSPFFDFGIARLRYRDRMLAVIAATDQSDPVAALEALPPVGSHALLSRMLAIHPAMVIDVLEPAPEAPPDPAGSDR